MNHNTSPHRFIRALLREPVDRTPIWIMRQAGRYLPEYRQLREQAGSFLNLMKTPAWATEATLQPLRRFDLDAAILFSDILTIPDAMGLGLQFVTGEGPVFSNPVRTAEAIAKLQVPRITDTLPYVLETVVRLKTELQDRVPLIGFSGSPWTLATYMVEGSSSKEFAHVKGLMYRDPTSMHALLDILSESVAAYLNAQIEAGADAVMLFDTWGGMLSPQDYLAFSLAPMTKVIQKLIKHRAGKPIPSILFTKGGGAWLEAMSTSGCNALGLDWTINIGEARRRVGDRVALQGNLDPAVLYAPPAVIVERAREILKDFGAHPGHVFNLGHGIHPGINPAHVEALITAVHEWKA